MSSSPKQQEKSETDDGAMKTAFEKAVLDLGGLRIMDGYGT
jgi:hypothetical protein